MKKKFLVKNRILLTSLVIIITIIIFLISLSVIKDPLNDNLATTPLVACLAERGVLVYGSRTCPACISFARQFGGYDAIAPIYIECTDERERCSQEMQTSSVPEIQINGELYEGLRTPEALARFVGCEI